MATTLKPNQATKGTRFKLWCATKQDYRTADITQTEAEEILRVANEKNGYTGKTYKVSGGPTEATKKALTAKPSPTLSLADSAGRHIVENIDKLVHSLIGESNIVGTVKNDTNFVADDGKRFKMFGGGCGFAWVSGYRKTEKNQALHKLIGGMKEAADLIVTQRLPADVVKMLKDNGSLRPLLAQSEAYNYTWQTIVISWLEKQGVKGAHVLSRQD